MAKADIVQLQENGEPKYVATHANAVEGLSDFIQKDYESEGSELKVYVSEGRGDNSLAEGTQNRPFRTIQAAIDSLPMVSSTKYYIYVEPGVYLENVNILGIKSARLEIVSTKHETESAKENGTSVLVRSLRFKDCAMYCGVRGITQTDVQNAVNNSFISFGRVSYGAIDNCRAVINTKSIEDFSAMYYNGSIGAIYNSIISNQNTAIRSDYCSSVRCTSGIIGTGNNVVWSSRASIIFRTGENITGSLAEQKEQGGQIFS